MLRQKVISQYQEADRAICGREDLSLKPQCARHRLTVDVWMSISELKRQRARAACFTVPHKAAAGTSTLGSTDGDLMVNYKAGAGKKLYQRKRPRTERMVTVDAMRQHV